MAAVSSRDGATMLAARFPGLEVERDEMITSVLKIALHKIAVIGNRFDKCLEFTTTRCKALSVSISELISRNNPGITFNQAKPETPLGEVVIDPRFHQSAPNEKAFECSAIRSFSCA